MINKKLADGRELVNKIANCVVKSRNSKYCYYYKLLKIQITKYFAIIILNEDGIS